MLERRGHLLLIASAAAVLPAAGLGAYSASKAGVEALGRSLRVELKPHGVTVGVGYYLFLNTPMVTRGRGQPGVPATRRPGMPHLIAKTWPLEPAIARTVASIEKRSRAVAHPPFLRGIMARARPARHAADRPRDGGRRCRAWRRRSPPRPSGSAPTPPAERVGEAGSELIGTVVAGHRITRLVGRGGMGVVYEAVEESLGRTVALKLVAPERAGEPGFRERFIAESRLAAAIDHPNVLPVFKAGEEDGLLYLAMRFVDGADLRSLSPLDPMRAAHVVAQVGAALDAAHARRLVHRDVKPANVLIARRRPRVPDRLRPRQGARRDHRARRARATSSARSTTSRPSASAARATGPAADLYSLGCVLYYTLTGAVPFPLEGTERKLWAHLSEPPPVLGLAVRRRDRPGAGQGPGSSATRAARRWASRRSPRRAARSRPPCSTRRAAASAASASRRRSSPARPPSLLTAFEHAAMRAALLREALADTPPERIERRLAEVRGGQDPGKAKLVAALARHLAVQRKMQAALAAYDADTERDPDRARDRPRPRPGGRHRRRASGSPRCRTRSRRSPSDARSRRWGIHHLGKLFAGPASTRH